MPCRHFPCFAALLLFLAGMALAHHAEPLYDMKHPIAVKGIVTRVEWSNPHVYLHVNVSGDNGSEEWLIELPAPHSLQRYGWTSTSVKAGERITCTGGRAKNSAHALRAVVIETADGKKLKTEK